MTTVENLLGWVRHRSPLRNASVLWHALRPIHDWGWRVFARHGIPRSINGSDRLRISPRLRRMSDEYEPEVWRCLMQEVRAGDIFVDVGAFYGLYSIAVGRRVGATGRVYAFEPDSGNFELLREHIRLNQLETTVIPENKAVAEKSGRAPFISGRGPESHLGTGGAGAKHVAVTTLVDHFRLGRIDLLKIDVEGFEQAVLEGAVGLLTDKPRRPRAIFIEMHPFAWPISGASSAAIIALLHQAGYELFSLDGRPVNEISTYSEAIARPVN